MHADSSRRHQMQPSDSSTTRCGTVLSQPRLTGVRPASIDVSSPPGGQITNGTGRFALNAIHQGTATWPWAMAIT